MMLDVQDRHELSRRSAATPAHSLSRRAVVSVTQCHFLRGPGARCGEGCGSSGVLELWGAHTGACWNREMDSFIEAAFLHS